MKNYVKSYVPLRFAVPLFLLVLLFTIGSTVTVQASSSHAHATWKIVPSANSQQQYNQLGGVVALSEHDVWAVGSSQGYPSPMQALIEHWNGKAWSLVSAPVVGLGSLLNAIAPIPHSRQLWAVGTYVNSQSKSYQTLIERWDGEQWSIVPSPFFKTDPENTSNMFYSVSALSRKNAWAVGVYDNGHGLMQTALIEHWNGMQWQAIAAPTPPGSTISFLYGVLALSERDVWAVGTASVNGGGDVVLLDHWNGTSWSLVAAPNPGSIANVLNSVIRIPGTNQLWAVGKALSGGAYQTLIERWDGKQWHVVASPNPGMNDNNLQNVIAVDDDEAWAVGSDTSGNGDQPLIEHWNGTAWSLFASPTPSDTVFLGAVTRIPKSRLLWAVGNYYATVNNQFDEFTLTEKYG